MKILDKIFNESLKIKLKDWTLIEVHGADALSFLQGQLTNNTENLTSQITTRLSLRGRVQSYFYLFKNNSNLYILIESHFQKTLLADLEKFIIMEDVSFREIAQDPYILLGVSEPDGKEWGKLNFLNLPAFLYSGEDEPELTYNEIELLGMLSGYPKWGLNISDKSLLNDTFLNEVAIDYRKGCFYGQETVAKIQSGRGGAYAPVILQSSQKIRDIGDFKIQGKRAGTIFQELKLENEYVYIANVLRDFRVEGKTLVIGTKGIEYSVKVKYLPYYDFSTKELLSKELFIRGSKLYGTKNSNKAKELLEKAISINPNNIDAIESLGVIYRQEEDYDNAILLMKSLLTISENSVMAHTNLSLIYMQQGKIEEAEKEKALATVKSFKKAGSEAKEKKALALQKEKERAEIDRREKMFMQVLDMDSNDTLALYGLSDICFARSEFKKAQTYLEKVLENDPKYSVAYLLLGKVFEKLDEKSKAKNIYEKGIEVAAQKGDLMPANEMQSRVSTL